jgi:hypothetical protein
MPLSVVGTAGLIKMVLVRPSAAAQVARDTILVLLIVSISEPHTLAAGQDRCIFVGSRAVNESDMLRERG